VSDGGDGASFLRTVAETDGPEETGRVAADLSSRLLPGDLILLEGEVGAGKSTFARAAMRALGVEGAIPSPTFTIGRTYRGRLPVSHIDLYRLGSLSDEIPDLLGEYLDRPASPSSSGRGAVERRFDRDRVARFGSKWNIWTTAEGESPSRCSQTTEPF
jgi:hypothetical protein